MEIQKALSFLSNWLLRLGVVIYFVPVLIAFWKNPGTSEEMWIWLHRAVFAIVFIVIVYVSLFLNRIKFQRFGFGFVFVYALFRLLETSFQTGIGSIQATWVLLIVCAFYFMTKGERTRKKPSF
jgi:hypothetical protein